MLRQLFNGLIEPVEGLLHHQVVKEPVFRILMLSGKETVARLRLTVQGDYLVVDAGEEEGTHVLPVTELTTTLVDAVDYLLDTVGSLMRMAVTQGTLGIAQQGRIELGIEGPEVPAPEIAQNSIADSHSLFFFAAKVVIFSENMTKIQKKDILRYLFAPLMRVKVKHISMDANKLRQADRISSLLLKKLTVALTDKEQRELDAWATTDRRRQYLQQLSDADFLADERQRLKETDWQTALQQMQQRIDEEQGSNSSSANAGNNRRLLRWAAVIVMLIATGVTVWYHRYSRVEPPVLDNQVQLAMQQSRQTGHQAAVVDTLANQSAERAAVKKELARCHVTGEAAEQLMKAQRVTTHQDKEYWLRLDDGTYIHLNNNTRVLFPEHFTGDTRDVVVDGEAYFTVAHDRRHPFIVHTPEGAIQVYGTEFHVSTRTQKGTTEVVLVKGSISVTPAYSGEEQMLKPGQKMTIGHDMAVIGNTDTEPYTAWNTGIFLFRYLPLQKVCDVLARWYDVQFEMEDDEVRQLPIVGTFDRYEQLENMLDALGKSTGLAIRRSGRTITISKDITYQ